VALSNWFLLPVGLSTIPWALTYDLDMFSELESITIVFDMEHNSPSLFVNRLRLAFQHVNTPTPTRYHPDNGDLMGLSAWAMLIDRYLGCTYMNREATLLTVKESLEMSLDLVEWSANHDDRRLIAWKVPSLDIKFLETTGLY